MFINSFFLSLFKDICMQKHMSKSMHICIYSILYCKIFNYQNYVLYNYLFKVQYITKKQDEKGDQNQILPIMWRKL